MDSNFVLFPNVRNIYGAIIVFGFTLYPYVYLVSRSAFINLSRSMQESARLLGLSQFQVFYKLSLPLIRPAVIGGLMLVVMETLSDFGAVDHFLSKLSLRVYSALGMVYMTCRLRCS